MNIKISCKSIAKRRNSVQSIIYTYDNPVNTVRDLLVETVRINIKEFEKRQENSEVLKVLTKEQIEDKSMSGKIDFGRVYNEKKPNFTEAAENALQCFEDGLVAVFVDGKRYEKLDGVLILHEESEVTFVRLAMLSGRMW